MNAAASRPRDAALMAVLFAILVSFALAANTLPSFGADAGVANADAESRSDIAPPEPGDYRTEDYRSPVPLTLQGATVLSDQEAMQLWSSKSAIFIDVYPHPPKPANLPAGTLWRETTHLSIEDAIWLPNVGYGVLSPASDSYFRRHLESLTNGNKGRGLVFFCLKNCWMSWNAAKRALSYGYTNVSWYRDGTDGWQEIGGFVTELSALP